MQVTELRWMRLTSHLIVNVGAYTVIEPEYKKRVEFLLQSNSICQIEIGSDQTD